MLALQSCHECVPAVDALYAAVKLSLSPLQHLSLQPHASVQVCGHVKYVAMSTVWQCGSLMQPLSLQSASKHLLLAYILVAGPVCLLAFQAAFPDAEAVLFALFSQMSSCHRSWLSVPKGAPASPALPAMVAIPVQGTLFPSRQASYMLVTEQPHCLPLCNRRTHINVPMTAMPVHAPGARGLISTARPQSLLSQGSLMQSRC